MNIKRSIIDSNNKLNSILSSFNSFSIEFSFRDRLIDIFPNYFFFHFVNRKYKKSKKIYIQKLDEIIFQVSADSKIVVVVSDTSIRN